MGIIKLVIDSMCLVWHWKSRKTIPSGASTRQAQLQREMETFTKDGARRRRRREKEKSLYALNLNWDICNHIHSYCSCLDVYAWARDNYAINHFILFSFSCFFFQIFSFQLTWTVSRKTTRFSRRISYKLCTDDSRFSIDLPQCVLMDNTTGTLMYVVDFKI